MKLEIRKTALPGCFEIRFFSIEDQRGSFVKTFSQTHFQSHGLHTDFAEEYFTTSKRDVVRGLHFQLPPHEHIKMVTCVEGSVFDAVVDLREGSPTFGKYETFLLSSAKPSSVYIPKGFAHGFCATSDRAILHYKTSTEHAPTSDSGILWNSASIPWPISHPILSERDQSFKPLHEFRSPFTYG